jgi:dTDP-4-dehydrorhamnose 3,5-epimerase
MSLPDASTESTMIEGVALLPLKQIADERGAVLHMLRDDTDVFTRFGEVYFSEVLPGVVKAWKRHREMTQRLAVPSGRVRFVLYDQRDNSPSRGEFQELCLGRPDNYDLLCIPPGIWYGFQCLSKTPALIANCPDLHHDPAESEARDYRTAGFPYAWDPGK